MNRDNYIHISNLVKTERCPICGSCPQLWEHETERSVQRVVMCENGEPFGPQVGIASAGCPLYAPPMEFYAPTRREALAYWNSYATALVAIRERNTR